MEEDWLLREASADVLYFRRLRFLDAANGSARTPAYAIFANKPRRGSTMSYVLQY